MLRTKKLKYFFALIDLIFPEAYSLIQNYQNTNKQYKRILTRKCKNLVLQAKEEIENSEF